RPATNSRRSSVAQSCRQSWIIGRPSICACCGTTSRREFTEGHPPWWNSSWRSEDAEQALAMFERAKSKFSKVTARDSDRGRTWLNWGGAQANLALAGKGEEWQKSLDEAKKLLKRLVKRVPRHDEKWPALDEIYAKLSDAYIVANEIKQAVSMVEEGLRRVPGSMVLHNERFFLHLVQGEIDRGIELVQKNPDALKDNPRRLFFEAVGKLLVGKEEPEYAARRFLYHTDDEYRN